MNKQRREKLSEAISEIEAAADKITDVMYDEQGVMASVPENLQGSERYGEMENAVDTMQEAIDGLNDITERLREL